MFDDFDWGDGGGGYSVSMPGGTGFDTTGLGSWGGGSIGDGSAADLSNWGNQYDGQSLESLTSNQGALDALFGQQGQAPGATGYSTAGLGKYGTPSTEAKIATAGGEPEKQNSMLKALGFKGTADGSATDFTDPKSLATLMKLIGTGGSFLSKLMGAKSQQQASSQSNALQQALAQQAQRTWTPQQQVWANSFFNTPYAPVSQRPKMSAADMPSSIVAGKGYAGGGEVQGDPTMDEGPLSRAHGHLSGPTGGQDDLVPANLAHGEYVLDADLVAQLGDGNNAAGAAKLDAWREKIRTHKRAAPADSIPPRAKSPEQYMKGIK